MLDRLTIPLLLVPGLHPSVGCRISRRVSRPRNLGSYPPPCEYCQQCSNQVSGSRAASALNQLQRKVLQKWDKGACMFDQFFLLTLIRKCPKTYSGELTLSPSWVRSWPIARLATSGFSLRTVANRPGRPNLSIALICDMVD